MPKPTNQDLYIMLVRMEERQINVVEKLDLITERQVKHEEKDEKRFENLNRYAKSIAIVATSVGMVGTWLWNKMVGKI